MDEFLTLEEAAEMMHLSYNITMRKVVAGEIEGCWKTTPPGDGGGKWLVPKKGLIAYIEKRQALCAKREPVAEVE
jgi:hypothetical protein